MTKAAAAFNPCLRSVILALAAGLACGAAACTDGEAAPPPAAALIEQYTMLYYRDLDAARRFYGGILALEATYDDEWVTLYRVVPGALLGVVREGGTAYHPARPENSVMLSLVTGDLEAWHARLKAYPEVRFLKEPYDHASVPIRAMLVADPGGYTVEFFQWLGK
jgi:catechol 2,3-dioxygenase-like lactoylglutathione lyase family enzyme